MTEEIVGTGAAGSGDDDFGALFVLPNVGIRPVGFFLARRFPDFLAGLFLEGEEGGLLFVVVDQIKAVFVEDGGGGGAPAIARLVGRDVAGPDEVAFEVEGIEPLAAEVAVEMVAIGDGGLGGVGVFEMDGGLGFATMDFFVPEDFSGVEVEAEDFPEVNGVRNGGPVAPEVEAFLRVLGFFQIDDGGEEDPFAPNDRARPSPAGDVGFPGHVLGAGPSVGKIGIF